MKYPNLLMEYIASRYHIHTLADRANVTEACMGAILKGEEEARIDEEIALARLFGVSTAYLFSPSVSILRKRKSAHRAKIAQLDSMFLKIAEAHSKKNKHAVKFMTDRFCCSGRTKYIKTIHDFKNDGFVIYADYRNLKKGMRLCLGLIRKDQRKPRDVTKKKAPADVGASGAGAQVLNQLQDTTKGINVNRRE